MNYVPGFMIPGGIDINNTKEKANMMEDNISKRKDNHSIAANLAENTHQSVSYLFHEILTVDQSF